VTQTVAQALQSAGEAGLDALDAQVLLSMCLHRPRTWLLAFDDELLDPACAQAFAALVRRRAGGLPLAYLTGEKEFCGLRLRVEPAVLIPRPETEHLVQWGLEILERHFANVACPRALDLGTGSGAIALALKTANPATEVEASDVDAQALGVAQDNAKRLGVDVRFRLGDWWAATPNQRFHLVLCNPPYISADDVHLAALAHEPRLALTPGVTGLEGLEVVIEGAPSHLTSSGWLLLEHGFDQSAQVTRLLRERGFRQVQSRRDLAGWPRCTGGCWPGP
jgi:release factor glutamine methyltransferase